MASKREILKRLSNILEVLRRTGPVHGRIPHEIDEIESELRIIELQYADAVDDFMANRINNRSKLRKVR